MISTKAAFQIGICTLMAITTLSWADNRTENTKIPVYPSELDASAGIDSPAIKIDNLVFISGQGTGSTKNAEDIEAQIEEAFKRLSIIANAAGGALDDIVKVTVYLADLSDYSILNKVMSKYFTKPFLRVQPLECQAYLKITELKWMLLCSLKITLWSGLRKGSMRYFMYKTTIECLHFYML